MGIYTYIAADFDHDKNAVDYIYRLRDKGYLSFHDAHDIQQSNDSSLPCSIKKSLKKRMDKAEYELSFANQFDKIVLNDDLETAQGEMIDLVRGFLGK